MQTQRFSNIFILLFLLLPLSLFGQENLKIEKIYFQNEIIRKVSVGDGGVWVIKGQDSTGVGKLEPSGLERDYTATVNSAYPLTGIVGKYGDSAMIATKGNYLLMFDKGKITRLDEKNGIKTEIIKNIDGFSNYSIIASDSGALESYDNINFSDVRILDGWPMEIFKNKHTNLFTGRIEDKFILAYSCKFDFCLDGKGKKGDYHFCTKGAFDESYRQFTTDSKGIPKVYAVSTGGPFYLGNPSGLRHVVAGNYEDAYHYLKDTAVYDVTPYYNKLSLIGTEQGLYYTLENIPGRLYKISLGEDYAVFDICTDKSKGIIWLATDKGLLKMKDESFTNPDDLAKGNFEWIKRLGGKFLDRANSSITDKKGNLYITGSFQGMVNFGDSTLIAQNSKDFYLAKYNSIGKLLWVRSAYNKNGNGVALNEEASVVRLNSKGEVFVIFESNNSDKGGWFLNFGKGEIPTEKMNENLKLLKYDKDGNFLSIKSLNFFSALPYSISMDIDGDDNIYFAYNGAGPNRVVKFNPDLEVLWDKEITKKMDAFKLRENGGFYISTYFKSNIKIDKVELEGSVTGNSGLFYFDKNGKANWGKCFNNTPGSSIQYIEEDRIGSVFILGDLNGSTFQEYSGNTMYRNFLAKINPAGDIDWVIDGIGDLRNCQLEIDSLGNSYFGSLLYYGNIEFDGKVVLKPTVGKPESFLVKFDPYGSMSWIRKINGYNLSFSLFNRNINLITAIPGDPDIIYNYSSYYGFERRDTDILLAKFRDTTSYLDRNLVRGKAFHDKNSNNKYDLGDEAIRNNIIKAMPGPVYSRTNQAGDYFLYLPKGNYTIEQIIPDYKGKRITQTYPSQPYTVSFNSTNADTVGFDFAHEVQVAPHLTVDIASARFRRCFTNNTVVEYCNEGFATAENVQLVLEYPDYVIPQSSSIPWSAKSGKKLTFNLGTVQAQQCRTITLTDSVMCGDERIRGLTQCIRAYITPASQVEVDPRWDKSELKLTAECRDNGFVRLGMENNGNGNMADSAFFRIFLDQKLAYSGKYMLAKGEKLSLNMLANGKQLHLEADLSPFHPRKKTTSIYISGCEENGSAVIRNTHTNQLPQEDEAPQFEIACLEILDSYDPNDKQVIPAGISANNYVAEGAVLEYTVRFQNTGTDVAYNIVITDQLDENLDIATLEMGLSSHPMEWELAGKGQPTLVWRFKNIMLPDSTTNEKGSHGFVKFKIGQKEEVSRGTVIKNKAAIFFDYNSPIITNEVFTTIGIPEVTQLGDVIIQNCNVPFALQAEQDSEIVLCDDEQLVLSRKHPGQGRGKWKLVKGEGTINELYNPTTSVSKVGLGENIFEWEVVYCDQRLSSKIIVIREQKPSPPQPAPLQHYCEGDAVPTFTAVGEQLEWYSDKELSQLLARGNSYTASQLAAGNLYVTQQGGSCRSEAAIITVVVHPKPAPPVTTALVDFCVETENLQLLAEGERIKWYADAQREALLAEGREFTPSLKEATSFYVSQSSTYCESDLKEVQVKTKIFDPSKAFFANVITPNGDDKNQSFYLKHFETEECLGGFLSVKIMNRYGKQIFGSTDRDFRWEADKLSPGVYFYNISYAQKSFSGSVQVIR